MKKKSIHTKFPLAKIKKIIQENEEIGKLKHSTPFVISLCLEKFIAKIVKDVEVTYGEKEKWTPSHLYV